MECIICKEGKGHKVSLANDVNNEQGKICKKCSKARRDFCIHCGKANKKENMRWDIIGEPICKKCTGTAAKKCENCFFRSLVSCSCQKYWCKMCAESHFIGMNNQGTPHQFTSYGEDTKVPGIDRRYFILFDRGVEVLRQNPMHGNVRKVLAEILKLENISTMSEFYRIEQSKLVMLANMLMELDIEQHLVCELREEFAYLKINQGYWTAGINELKLESPSTKAKYIVFATAYQDIIKNQHDGWLVQISKQFDSLESELTEDLESEKVGSKIKHTFENQILKTRIKSLVLDSKPSLLVVRGLLRQREAMNLPKLDFCIVYVSTYFHDIPELALFLLSKMKLLSNDRDRLAQEGIEIASNALQIMLKHTGWENEDINEFVYYLAYAYFSAEKHGESENLFLKTIQIEQIFKISYCIPSCLNFLQDIYTNWIRDKQREKLIENLRKQLD